jgi:hypothetical protein
MAAGPGWGPPAIDAGAISGLLDPFIKRQKEERAASSLAQGMKALQAGDMSGAAAAMEGLAADSPTLAAHMMAQFTAQQQLNETRQQHGVETYYKGITPHVVGEGPFGKDYEKPGLPPGYKLPFGASAQPGATGATVQPQPTQQGSVNSQLIAALRSGKTGDEFLAMVPAEYHGLIKQLANYEQDPRRYQAMGKNEILGLAQAYKPDYQPGNYESVRLTKSGLQQGTPNSTGGQVKNLSVASHHVEALYRLRDLMTENHVSPTDSATVNRLLQVVSKEFNDPTLASWDALRAVVAPEIQNVISQGKGGTGHERETLARILAPNSNASSSFAVLDTLKGAMAPRFAALKQQVDQGFHGSMPFHYAGYLLPAAKLNTLEATGVNVAGLTPKAVETLFRNRDKPNALKQFDAQFGEGRAEEVLNGLR